MKKLFTVLMVLAIATVGYAQTKMVSKKDAKPSKVQLAPRSQGSEVMENVLSEPTMVREFGELDYSTYDWQSNDGARTWTKVWPDGKVNFAFTASTTTTFTDRGTAIGTYDSNTDEWIPSGGRVENEKTGFGTIAQYGANGLVIAAHTATECHVFIAPDKDNIAPNSLAPVSILDNTYDPTWPNVMTSGANRDIIHIAVTANGHTDVPGAEGVTDPIIYFRSKDGGATWDKQNVILPYMDYEYSRDFTSNCCYWMETTEDNCLALVVNNAWSDGMVLYSYDDGDTWERKVFYSHPTITGDTASGWWFFYPRWTSAQWDDAMNLHLAYEFNATTGEAGSGSYYPSLGGVAYWNETLPYNEEGTAVSAIPGNLTPGEPFVMDSAYIYQDLYASWFFSDATHDMWPEYIGYLTPLDSDGNVEDPDTWEEFNLLGSDARDLHGHYNNGVCGFPVLMKVGSSDWVAVWSAMDENHMDGTNYYFHLFANHSGDNGRTWGLQKHLCTSWEFDNSEMVYPQAAVIGDQLIIAVQEDGATGTFVQEDEADATDNFYHGLTFSLTELWPNVNVPEVVSHNTKMSIFPNPASTKLNVTLNQGAEIVIYNITGQVVNTVNGHVGENVIEISNLSSGVYFISAGSDTQKFIVK